MDQSSKFFPFLSDLTVGAFSEWEGVRYARAEFREAYFSNSLYSDFSVEFPQGIRTAVLKRKSEFLAGRVLANELLRLENLSGCCVGVGTHRNPLWPVGVLGSISHSSGVAVCLISRHEKIKGVGVDVESVVDGDTVRLICDSIVNEKEKLIMHSIEMDFDLLFTIIFSAKESFFKAAFPLVNRYFDFDVIEFIDFGEDDNTLLFVIKKKVSTDFDVFDLIKANFQLLGKKMVMTRVFIL